MSGRQQTEVRAVAIRFHGLSPGQSPYVEIDYSDGTTVTVGSGDDPSLLTDALNTQPGDIR